VNPEKVRGDQLRRAFEAGLERAGWDELLWYETTPEDHGQGVARAAISAGAEVVAAVGGDGTVRAVAAALRGTRVALALVPQGTGNLLARNLGQPFGLATAVRIAFGEGQRAIDIGIAEARFADGSTSGPEPFLVMAGIGLDATMIRNTNAALKRRIGWVAYWDAAWRSIPSSRPFRIGYRIAGHGARSTTVHAFVVANCGALPGGLELLPGTVIDDGLLDVAAIHARGRILGLLRVWTTVVIENGILRKSTLGSRIADRRPSAARDVTYRRGTSITLSVPVPTAVEVDGDDLGDATAAWMRVEPRALLVKIRT